MKTLNPLYCIERLKHMAMQVHYWRWRYRATRNDLVACAHQRDNAIRRLESAEKALSMIIEPKLSFDQVCKGYEAAREHFEEIRNGHL